ncbi:MAG: alkane 1-monooxygenase [Acinetobacter sp.]|nr:alkane 1-monooxygenase [Acinetobacter sp.]
MTTSTLKLTETAYKDPKKWLWLSSALVPLIAPLGTFLYLQTGQAAWLWLFLGIVYLAAPLLDIIFGEDKANPPESAVPALEADPFYRRITYATVAVLTFSFIYNAIFLATHELAWYHWLATAMGTGVLLGFGINLSHEMGHKKRPFDRFLALFTASLSGYGHFSIEHNRGHHRYVATPEDPASSRMGENIYKFAVREIPGAFFRAWELEKQRLERINKKVWSLENEMLQGGLMTITLYSTLTAIYGLPMLAGLVLMAFWGMYQLTSANYIEHYGITRQKKADGRYELCQPHHSWNSNHLITNLMLFQLQRHSDHHANPTRSYQSLRDFSDLPSLPSGYFGMFLIAYIPPLWFAVMNPKLVQIVNGDSKRINFDASKKQQLIKQYNLS